jgi:multiple sugar transport system substrate-binding protein
MQECIAEPGDKIEISVGHTWDAVFFERQLQFDKLFMQRHPNITVKAEKTPWGEYRQKYTAAAAGNAMPDILYTQFSWAQETIRSGLYIALDDYIAKEKDFNLGDFTKPSLVSYQYDGKLWGIPYDEGSRVTCTTTKTCLMPPEKPTPMIHGISRNSKPWRSN